MRRLRKLTNQMAHSLSKSSSASSSQNALKSQYISNQKHSFSSTTLNEEKEQKSVLIEEISGNYLVTLNRPKALNSLNMDMINILTPFYQKLISQKKPCTVVMRGEGNKAFCAGGDVRKLYDLGMAGAKIEEITEFFKEEYVLDHLLGTLPNYVNNVCLLNGITMGGGVGLSVHGKYRVATNQTLFAMPETGIGFYTDVGGSYFLSRLVPNGLGLYLGLNGHRLKGCDVFHAGIATHFVDESNLESLVNDLLNCKESVSTQSILGKYAMHSSKLNEFSLKNELNDIEDIFGYDGKSKCVEDIFERLEGIQDGNIWAEQTLKQLKAVSPTSLKVVYRALSEGRNKSLRECLDMEFDIVTEFMRQHDFYEGIRAQLVDKDRNPKWNPNNLSDVGSIDEYFPSL